MYEFARMHVYGYTVHVHVYDRAYAAAGTAIEFPKFFRRVVVRLCLETLMFLGC